MCIYKLYIINNYNLGKVLYDGALEHTVIYNWKNDRQREWEKLY